MIPNMSVTSVCIAGVTALMFSGGRTLARFVPTSFVAEENKPECISHVILGCAKSIVFSLSAHHALETRDAAYALELGWSFVLFELADLTFMLRHGLCTTDMIAHHLLFILGLPPFLVYSNSIELLIGTRLLLHETSSIFLDIFLFTRHREFPFVCNAAFVIFYVTFFWYRVVGTTRLCWEAYAESLVYFLVPVLCLQLWWFGMISHKLWVRVRKHILHAP